MTSTKWVIIIAGPSFLPQLGRLSQGSFRDRVEVYRRETERKIDRRISDG